MQKQQSNYDITEESKRHPIAFKLAQVTGRAMYLRTEQRPGWKAPMAIYVRTCEHCNSRSISYAAGYGRVLCDNRCDGGLRVMTWQRFRDHWWPGLSAMVTLILVCMVLFAIVRAVIILA